MNADERLTAELSDWREGQRRVMSEECPPDERHCTCVPTLRREIERLRAVVDAARNSDHDGEKDDCAICAALKRLDGAR